MWRSEAPWRKKSIILRRKYEVTGTVSSFFSWFINFDYKRARNFLTQEVEYKRKRDEIFSYIFADKTIWTAEKRVVYQFLGIRWHARIRSVYLLKSQKPDKTTFFMNFSGFFGVEIGKCELLYQKNMYI